MKTILFGVHGEGNGHFTRSSAVIQALQSRYHLIIVADGNAYTYLKKKVRGISEISSFHLVYKNNKIAPWRTFWRNVVDLPALVQSARSLRRIIRETKPDIMINDFNALVSYASLWYAIPLISIDNNQLVIKTKINLPWKWWWAKFKAAIAIRIMVPTASYRIIPSFYSPKITSKDVEIVPPILRTEVTELKTSEQDYVVVYQTSSSNEDLITVLRGIKETFIAYGFNKKNNEKNIVFKSFSESGFLADLAGAKAVIMNGGFSLMTECIHLKKPILSIPVKGQIEQMSNAWYLQRLGLGKCLRDNNQQQIRLFLKNILNYPKRESSPLDYGQGIQRIIEKVEELAK